MRLRNSIAALSIAALTIATFVWLSSQCLGEEKSAIDPTGTWKVVKINPETKSKGSEQTLKLRLDGGKLSGTITGRSSNNGKVRIFEWAIKDTKLQGSNITFSVTHAPVTGSGPDSTTMYEGKITGDAMKGKLEIELSGQTFSGEWEAKRAKE
jgi:hypothetical protein